jgi:hypothetical protein
MPDDLEGFLQKLESTEEDILDATLGILQADGGAIYPLDFLANAVMKRAVALISGFTTLIRAKNFSCAGALVRLHLDNVLRFSAAALVANPHDFAESVLRGEHVRKLKDKKGEQLTDAYLVKCLSVEYPWVSQVYDETSGYVHLSNKHVANAFRPTTDPSLGEFVVGKEDEFIPDSVRIKACMAMHATTNVLLKYLNSWRDVKNNARSKDSASK